MKIWIQIVLLTFLVTSCDYFRAPKEPKAIARVGKSYLYLEDIANLVPSGTSKKDSIAIVKSFIDRWATQKLLFEASERNISKAKVSEFNELIDQYKVDLYTKAYLEDLVIRQIDTVVTEAQIESYYNTNKQFFKNSSELVKMRYINLVKENPKFANIKAKFSSFTKKDRKELEQQAVKFKSYAFNDSIWVDINQVYEKLPFVNIENKNKYISSGINFDYPDSTTVWLVKVNKVLPKDSPTPLEFLKPTIKQIIINNRKLELINTLEKEITNDAINDNKYEIYK
ncbi:hypothetical protein M9Q43_05820 [Flavobacterium sp. HXWNR29]|jgi:hypothetical protein|uniref:hypothetical protein n=1 Tax=Flavobacterium odoriferum TaxID=2946604 RepID=UPI0021CB9663|nr:hypothetical protein [Flavobacterium sp. HXWNR29]MCU4188682.1 hypothetical protein [Flavobacterium sp. HXWNR29]